MIWEPTNGTEAISSWLNQGVLFGLVLATAMVIGCAVLWAFGSLAGNGQAAGRGRAGIGLSLAAALLLGAGFTYLHWTSSTQAVAFAGDPAQYGINDTPQIPGAWEVIDLSERWTGNINAYRATIGLPPFSTDRSLTERATACARSRAGQSGECPSPPACEDSVDPTFGAWDYGPGELDKITGDLTEEQIRWPNPWHVGVSTPVTLDGSSDMNSAWVALRDNANKKAIVVALMENAAGLAVWTYCPRYN
jgi:hypothetical protein